MIKKAMTGMCSMSGALGTASSAGNETQCNSYIHDKHVRQRVLVCSQSSAPSHVFEANSQQEMKHIAIVTYMTSMYGSVC